MPDTPPAYEHPDWVADQQRQIDAMKREHMKLMEEEVFRRAAAAKDMTAMNVFQTLTMQEDERLKRIYGPRAAKNMWRHALIGSTVNDPAEDDFEDFPGTDSVASFVVRLGARFPDVMRRIEERLADLRLRYPDYMTYRWYQSVTGFVRSSVHDDFPGEDSLEQFLCETLAEIVARSNEPAGDEPGSPATPE